jgi:hypothetical protein
MPDELSPVPPTDLPAFVRWWAVRSFGAPPAKVRITIETANGAKIELGRLDLGDEQLGEMDRDILEVLSKLGAGDRLTAEELAPKAGYEPDSNFRSHLAFLAKTGRIVSSRKGYSLA